MAGHECYHCKQWIDEGDTHDCWTTTEAALTQDLSDDLQEAWQRLRETAVTFGEQRIYASHSSIMFSRRSCYFFVRPKKTFLEVCVFLGRAVKAPQIRRVDPASKSKTVHVIRVTHRDEVEPPVTDWLREAYELAGGPAPRAGGTRSPQVSVPARKRTAAAGKQPVPAPAASAEGRRRQPGAKPGNRPAGPGRPRQTKIET